MMTGNGCGGRSSLWLRSGLFRLRRVVPPGSVAVPVASRPIAAYQALTLEDLLDPRGTLLGGDELTELVRGVDLPEKPAELMVASVVL